MLLLLAYQVAASRVPAAMERTAGTLTQTPYERYFAGAQFVHFLLGPATVALAIPLYRNFDLIRRSAVPILVATIAGALTSAFASVWIERALGASHEITHSMAAHAVTASVAMALAERIGGVPSLTAVLVILTGVAGAVMAPSFSGTGRRIGRRAASESAPLRAASVPLARSHATVHANTLAPRRSGFGLGLPFEPDF